MKQLLAALIGSAAVTAAIIALSVSSKAYGIENEYVPPPQQSITPDVPAPPPQITPVEIPFKSICADTATMIKLFVDNGFHATWLGTNVLTGNDTIIAMNKDKANPSMIVIQFNRQENVMCLVIESNNVEVNGDNVNDILKFYLAK
jgi:hypothetical protein